MGLESSSDYYQYGRKGNPEAHKSLGIVPATEEVGTFRYFDMFIWDGFVEYLVELEKTRLVYLWAPWLPVVLYTYRNKANNQN